MTGKTTIEWTHQPGFMGDVWNPTTGCTRVSAGCDNCYAFALHDKRYALNLKAAMVFWGAAGENTIALNATPKKTAAAISQARHGGAKLPWPRQYDLPFSQVQLLEDRLDAPLRRRKPTCYFVDSMSDLFHEDVPDEYIAEVWGVMARSPQHRFLILTKRPERMRHWTADVVRFTEGLPNVWLGTSVEDQASADERIPHLLATPAAVRFLSCEPLLGRVDITRFRHFEDWCSKCRRALERPPGAMAIECAVCGTAASLLIPHWLDWVIVGGESGPRARPMDLAWARSIVEQCRAASVTPFVKQLGSLPAVRDELVDEGSGYQVIDTEAFTGYRYPHVREAHGRDMTEWPEDLRIREFPR